MTEENLFKLPTTQCARRMREEQERKTSEQTALTSTPSVEVKAGVNILTDKET